MDTEVNNNVVEGALVATEERVNLPAARTTFADLGPSEKVAQATEIANQLSDIIKQQKMFQKFGAKDHVTVEGWNTLGAFLGITVREVSCELQADGSYVAKVDLINGNGVIVGGASHICGDATDRNWCKKEAYAKRSMAVTRATGKAFRLGYSWIMKLAGYEVTPAEEMPPAMAEIFNFENSEHKNKLVLMLKSRFRIVNMDVAKEVATKMSGKPFTQSEVANCIPKQ